METQQRKPPDRPPVTASQVNWDAVAIAYCTTHFTEAQFRTLIGWMRTDNPHVRLRVVCAGNPPTDSAGEWVKRYWAPWLDAQHPNPAKPGELRWYVTDEKGEDLEVPGPEPVMVAGELMQPKSRTFIPSRVDDNLFLMTTGRQEVIAATADFTFADVTAVDLPVGAIVVGDHLAINTIFNSAMDDKFSIGDQAIGSAAVATTYAAQSSDIAAPGPIPIVPTGKKYSVPATVGVVWTGSGAAPTAGAGRLTVLYIVDGRAAFSQG